MQYRRGSEHSIADFLSRLPLPNTEPRESHANEREYILLAQAMEETAICTREVKQTTYLEPTLQQVNTDFRRMATVLTIASRAIPVVHQQENRTDRKEEFGVLVHRIVLPFGVRRRSSILLHETHPGMVSMKCRWTGVDAVLEEVILEVVQYKQGSRIVIVHSAQGRHRRHLDQLRRRVESMDTDLDQRSKQEPAEDTRERLQDSPEETVSESARSPLLCR